MRLKTFGATVLGIIWTMLAAGTGWRVYESASRHGLWFAIPLACVVAVVWAAALVKLRVFWPVVCASLWWGIVALTIGILLVTIEPEARVSGWGFGALAFFVWLLVVFRWNSFIAVGNAYYAFLWFWVVFVAVLVVVSVPIIPLRLAFEIGSAIGEDPPFSLRALIVILWAMLIWFRVPWRYPWLLLLAILLPLRLPAFVVTAIGVIKLIIEAVEKRNVLARSRLKAGPMPVPTRGLVEFGGYDSSSA